MKLIRLIIIPTIVILLHEVIDNLYKILMHRPAFQLRMTAISR